MRMITVEEEKLILDNFSARRGNRPVFEEEVQTVLEWAVRVRMDVGVLDNILRGHFSVDVVGGTCVFSVTAEGGAHFESLLGESAKSVKRNEPEPVDPNKPLYLEKRVLLFFGLANQRFAELRGEQTKILAEVLDVSEVRILLAIDGLQTKGLIQKQEPEST